MMDFKEHSEMLEDENRRLRDAVIALVLEVIELRTTNKELVVALRERDGTH